MKISIKLNRDEAWALLDVLESIIIIGGLPDSRRDAIIYALMLKFYESLSQKTVLIKKTVKVSVPAEVALAFCEALDEPSYNLPDFTANVVRKIVARFDQKTAGLFKN